MDPHRSLIVGQQSPVSVNKGQRFAGSLRLLVQSTTEQLKVHICSPSLHKTKALKGNFPWLQTKRKENDFAVILHKSHNFNVFFLLQKSARLRERKAFDGGRPVVVSSEMRPHSKYLLTACAASVLLALIAAIHLLSATVGVSRGYTDYHQGRAIHMADSRID